MEHRDLEDAEQSGLGVVSGEHQRVVVLRDSRNEPEDPDEEEDGPEDPGDDLDGAAGRACSRVCVGGGHDDPFLLRRGSSVVVHLSEGIRSRAPFGWVGLPMKCARRWCRSPLRGGSSAILGRISDRILLGDPRRTEFEARVRAREALGAWCALAGTQASATPDRARSPIRRCARRGAAARDGGPPLRCVPGDHPKRPEM
ncbi:Uncharacterised protein [Mycobacteroides abscessus subsp. abscessus]|nr:Uncharacterised protein [Mycobacteroides abscessus subsp. abscessus]